MASPPRPPLLRRRAGSGSPATDERKIGRLVLPPSAGAEGLPRLVEDWQSCDCGRRAPVRFCPVSSRFTGELEEPEVVRGAEVEDVDLAVLNRT